MPYGAKQLNLLAVVVWHKIRQVEISGYSTVGVGTRQTPDGAGMPETGASREDG